MHKHWHWVFDDSMRQTWICFCYRFYASLVNSFDAVDSIRQLSLIFQWRFQGVLWLYFCWRFLVGRDAVFTNKFHASTMTLFSIMISLVNRELVFAVDSTRQSWHNFQRWFLVLQWLSFRWRFMHKHWLWVFDDSMRQTWIYFCYRFYASLVNSLTLSTPFVTCHSYFSGNFKVNTHSVFADDFWSVVTRFSLTIPCVNDDSIFSNDFTRQPLISIRCRFYPSAVTQFSKMISRSTVTQFSLMIYGSALA
jgi:hypothetical protein